MCPYDRRHRLARDLAIGSVGPSLEGGFGIREFAEKLVAGCSVVSGERRSERGEDARLPVDQRPVAIEGQGMEGAVVEVRHERIVKPGRACRTSSTGCTGPSTRVAPTDGRAGRS